jgi:PAS domain-containing protein
MNFTRFNELLLQSVGVGLAVLDRETQRILFHNRRFGEWFGEGAGGAELSRLVPGLDVAAMREALAVASTFTAEHEVKIGRRSTSLAVQISLSEHNGLSVLIVEC